MPRGRPKSPEGYDPIFHMRMPADMLENLRKEAARKKVTLTCHVMDLIRTGQRHYARFGAS